MADVKEEVKAEVERVEQKAADLVDVVLRHKLVTANVTQPDGSVKDVVYGDESKEPVTVSVPADVAEDLKRRDDEYSAYLEGLNESKVVTINAGNIDAAGK